ncbi:MAG TPA: hypothetical protein VFF94_12845, partial [Novosphingobium sp.]|nr:hypothetical protein [Novosphingobium sp.]
MLRQNTLHYGMDPDPHGGPDSGAPGRQAVVVLGMHRSGTSALARIVSLLGADLPATLMPADASNVAGHWESGPVCGVNEALLASAGSRWDDWQGLNPAWYGSAREAQF